MLAAVVLGGTLDAHQDEARIVLDLAEPHDAHAVIGAVVNHVQANVPAIERDRALDAVPVAVANPSAASALDQARMQLLQQLLAAELNASAFGSAPAGGMGQFAIWEAAYCGTNQTAIQNALQGAASFNNSGDSATFTPGTSADSKNARAIADRVYWNVLP